MARILLSIVLFAAIAFAADLPEEKRELQQWLYWGSFVVFIIAAGTDWFDGYFARKYDMVTKLGRILDPFADKMIICGAFILLAATEPMVAGPWWFCLKAWMVVIVVAREILVTMLRSLIEGAGGDFSAKMTGKIKMFAQCFVPPTVLFYLAMGYTPETVPPWLLVMLVGSIWLTLIFTLQSGFSYISRAIKLADEQKNKATS